MKGDSYGFWRNFCSQGCFVGVFWGGWGVRVKFPPSGCGEAGKSENLKKIGNKAIFVPFNVRDTDVHIWNREDLG